MNLQATSQQRYIFWFNFSDILEQSKKATIASPPIPDRPSRSTPTLQNSPAGWEEMLDEDGNIYYVNYFKCITQWENPGKKLMAWNSFPRKIKEVVLFLHIDHYCGGNNIYIEIVQNGTFCITQTQNIFRGTSASWTGIQLSSCFGKDFNVWQDNLYFRTKTTDTNDFCPRNLTITLNNAKYQSDIMTDWVNNKKGGELRTVRKIVGLYFILLWLYL